MPEVDIAPHEDGDFFVDYEDKKFEDVQAKPGEKALVTFHTVAFEGSIGLVNLLSASRLIRKGFDTSVLLYGPGVTLGIQRGYPTLGDSAFPGHQNYADRLEKIMALYGHGEPALVPGIEPIDPKDVLDIILLHRRDDAFVMNTWTM